ncbi:MAG: hypothetical protein RR595_15965 [Lysinibacillus sp.]
MSVFEKVSNTKLPEMADKYLLAKQAEKDAFLARGTGNKYLKWRLF